MDSLENYMQEITRQNKVILDAKDPIFMLHTFLEKFEKDLQTTQGTILDNFVACMELEHTKQSNMTIEQLKRLLESALSVGRDNAQATYRAEASKLIEDFKQILDTQWQEPQRDLRILWFFVYTLGIGQFALFCLLALNYFAK